MGPTLRSDPTLRTTDALKQEEQPTLQTREYFYAKRKSYSLEIDRDKDINFGRINYSRVLNQGNSKRDGSKAQSEGDLLFSISFLTSLFFISVSILAPCYSDQHCPTAIVPHQLKLQPAKAMPNRLTFLFLFQDFA